MTDTQSTHENQEFIAFIVRNQEFCIDIKKIREIRGWTHATRLPHVPGYVVGVINLRGTILPIFDVAQRFGMEPSTSGGQNVIIVTQIGARTVGLLVDSVSDILHVDSAQIRDLPDVESDMARDFLKRVILHDNRIICEIMLEKVVDTDQLEAAA
ncbi:chemotaxis protein CheW [Zhengella mangrovi]|uniref:Chemotaxis protein CheW n=1 Tax=Zhengella mangrovi TaxID=1982044 RepID=A0A2G1QJJ2_9HYPH|nr:chemotaxis protein CheW [Zhengella mangrovi]PHP65693.1 chemotaxis protein CheW [Zhengella mangrovi]